MLVIFAVILWIIWYYFHADIRNLIRWIRYAEMSVISWFVGDDFTVMHEGLELPFHAIDDPKNPCDLSREICPGYENTSAYSKNKLTYSHLSYFTSLTMQPLKPVFLALLGLAAFWSILWGPETHYRKKLNLEGLIGRQSKVFPVVAPFVKFNPSTQPNRPPGSPVPAELPLFSEALGPEEWLAYNSIPVPDGKIDKKAATKAFFKQLGGRWKGSQALEPYKQILLAAFCLKAARKRRDADEMLGRLALCWGHKGGLKLSRDRSLLSDARKILRDKNLAGKTLAQCNKHAFSTTALMRALAFAREEGGVLAPAQFVWLRGHDRTLWYPLNNLGRESFHMEALGAMTHYKSEKMTERPIPVPKLEDAVKTITEYMAGNKARPIPQLDYSTSKKRGVKKAV